MTKKELLERTRFKTSWEILKRRLKVKNPGKEYYNLQQILETVCNIVDKFKSNEELSHMLIKSGAGIIFPKCTECMIDRTFKKDYCKVEFRIYNKVALIELNSTDEKVDFTKLMDYSTNDTLEEIRVFEAILKAHVFLNNEFVDFYELLEKIDFSSATFNENERLMFEISFETRMIMLNYSIGDFIIKYNVLEEKIEVKCLGADEKALKFLETKIKRALRKIYLHRNQIPGIILKEIK